jgi:hypothetical protein
MSSNGMKNKEQIRQPRFRNSAKGSKTPLTFYRSAKPEPETASPFKKKQSKPRSRASKFFVGLFNILVLVVLLALFMYSLIIRPSAKAEVNSQLFHTQSEYQTAANKILSGVKYSNKITFSEKSVIAKMQEQFPEITSMRVELPIFTQNPILHLKIASPTFTIKSNGQSYIVDSDGVAVAKSGDFVGSNKLVGIEDQSGFKIESGKQVLSAGSVKFINTIIKQCEHANVKISSLILPSKAQELHLRTADKPYYIKFYLGGDAQLQTGQFLASRHQFDAGDPQPGEYLDVRVPGKIFYK